LEETVEWTWTLKRTWVVLGWLGENPKSPSNFKRIDHEIIRYERITNENRKYDK